MKTTTLLSLTALMATASLTASAAEPLEIRAADLIGKVYCTADPRAGEEECRDAAHTLYDAPRMDEGAEWIGAEEGFRVNYGGLTPEAEAMARYERGSVAGYGYIFYFPYEAAGRTSANCEQSAFCTCLLKDLAEMGVILGADPTTDALFDVAGIYHGGDVQISLREEVISETIAPDQLAGAIPADRTGEFILFVSVVPAHALDYTSQAD
ncbi:MAG: hypothetical protein HDR80_06225 [Bacteroides sp.]|nr:hypothetical protein [Bacteroides sp.]